MVCEEILHGRQVTANGYARDGRVTMLGTVDSVMYPGTDQFQRFQYPSSLPADLLARVDARRRAPARGAGLHARHVQRRDAHRPGRGGARDRDQPARRGPVLRPLRARRRLQPLRRDARPALRRRARGAPPRGPRPPRGELRAARFQRRGPLALASGARGRRAAGAPSRRARDGLSEARRRPRSAR